MTKEEFLQKLSINDKLINKRCTESYLIKHNLLSVLDELTTVNFGSISDRIKLLKYGGGFCKVCDIRTNIHVSGKGFSDYCKDHFHEPNRNKTAHNNIEVDLELVKKLYFEESKSLLEISKILGNVSNVTLNKKFIEAGIELRSHSDNQKIKAKRGHIKPLIIIDRTELIKLYSVDKIPVKELSEKFNCDPETIRRFLKQEGVDRFHKTSSIEWKMKQFLREIGINYIQNTRKLIPPLETDFYLEKFNLAIELNGLYTHAIKSGSKTKNYHYEKYIQHKNIGIKLLQFWEDDINNRFEVIKSIILNSCRMNTRKLDARKCIIKELNFKELFEFCSENHLQSTIGNNSKGIGLFHEDILVSCIGFVISKNETIITRFCSLKNYNVRGAFSRLLNQLSGRIKTYSSNDISDGHLYEINGFECVSEKLDMFYTDYDIILNRQGFMKNKLKSKLKIFHETLTENDNMILNGYDIIYKSGVKTWVKDN